MPKHSDNDMLNGTLIISDGANGNPPSPENPNGNPQTDGNMTDVPAFKVLAGTKNLSGHYVKSEGGRLEYDDELSGEHLFIDYVECGTFVVQVMARDKRRVRMMRNSIEDGLDDVSAYDFFARRGWNIIQVCSGRGEDGKIGLPIIVLCQSGL